MPPVRVFVFCRCNALHNNLWSATENAPQPLIDSSQLIIFVLIAAMLFCSWLGLQLFRKLQWAQRHAENPSKRPLFIALAYFVLMISCFVFLFQAASPH